MPKVAYSEEDKERIRNALITVGLELMAKRGIQHTTVEQIYKKLVFQGRSSTLFSQPKKTWSLKRCICNSLKSLSMYRN